MNAVIQSSISQLLQTCEAVGVDVLDRRERPAAGALEQLQHMLNRWVHSNCSRTITS